MNYLPFILVLIIAAAIFIYEPYYAPISIVLVAIALLLMFRKSYLLGIFCLIGTFVLLPLGYHWEGFVLSIFGIILVLYHPMDKTARSAWDEMKKADAPYPDVKLDANIKGFSKSAAEWLIPAPNTEINSGGFLHKSSQIAKNFFKEMEDIFKR
jgi:hypothetical protein